METNQIMDGQQIIYVEYEPHNTNWLNHIFNIIRNFISAGNLIRIIINHKFFGPCVEYAFSIGSLVVLVLIKNPQILTPGQLNVLLKLDKLIMFYNISQIFAFKDIMGQLSKYFQDFENLFGQL